MLSRVFDFFKRDRAKKELPNKTLIPNPIPKEVKMGSHWGWIDRLVQRSKSVFLQKQISKGLHIAHPHSPIQPLRKIRPIARFYSSTQWVKK